MAFYWKGGAPGEIRTPDPLVRSQILYPTELRAQWEPILAELSDLSSGIARALKRCFVIYTFLARMFCCCCVMVYYPSSVAVASSLARGEGHFKVNEYIQVALKIDNSSMIRQNTYTINIFMWRDLMLTATLILSEKRTHLLACLLLCLMPLVGMSIDLISPALPAIAKSLHISHSLAKSTIYIYLVGAIFGNFVTGFLSDAIGRQKLFRLGLMGFIVASLLPVFFPTIGVLLIARFLQGLMLGSVSVLIRAIFSDLLPHEKLVRFSMLTGTLWGLGPVLGPVIGGYLQFYFGWQACFDFFALFAFVPFILLSCLLPETHLQRHPLKLSIIKQNVAEILKNKIFLSVSAIMGLSYGLIITFHTMAPFLVQDTLGYTSIFFGHLAFLLGIGYVLSTFLGRKLYRHYPIATVLSRSILALWCLALLMLLATYFFPSSISILSIASLFVFAGAGMVFPLAMSKGNTMLRHIAGAATAIMFFINIGISSLISFLVSLISAHQISSILICYVVLLSLILITYQSIHALLQRDN